MKKEEDALRADFSHQMKEYWEEQALSSDDPLKIARVQSEDTPEFILKMFTEFEIDMAKFCFDGHSGLILDSGCGTGNIFMHALSLCPESNVKYIGLDFSRNILRKAAARAKGSNAYFFQGSVTTLPFRDNTFDRIICSGVMTYLASLNEVDKSIRECRRVLKPDGILIIDFFNKFSPSIVLSSLLHPSSTKPPKYVSPFWFIKELKKVGFKIIQYQGFNFSLFTGYRYLFMHRWRILDPYFIQERWSSFVERKVIPHIDKISLLGHRVYIKCEK